MACCLVATVFVSSGAGPARRYTAELWDGTRVEGNEVSPWHDSAARPSLDRAALFHPANPVRWLRDNEQPLSPPPTACVETWLGDVLPGRVAAFHPGSDASFEAQPPHLLVECVDVASSSRHPQHTGPVRVAPHWVRRVIWQRRPGIDRLEPGTLTYRDGRQIRFTSARWEGESVRLLLDEETASVPFAQLAELHLPRPDIWDLYYEQAAALAADHSSNDASLEGRGRLLRFSCADGLRLTASTERFAAVSLGHAGDPANWVHVLQPAWSLDPLWLRHRQIGLRHYWLPHQPPLSAIEVARVQRRATLAHGWSWRLDRNVRDGILRSGDPAFDAPWGFGVQADCELAFELPASATAFRTWMGLDRVAGDGGCAQGIVVLRTDQNHELFRGPVMVGSRDVYDTGPLVLPPTPEGAPRSLLLVADSAHAARPAGADPFDIRDTVDWFGPQLELDPALLRQETRQRVARLVAAWEGWRIDDSSAGLHTAIHKASGPALGEQPFRLQVEPRDHFLKLTRRMTIDDARPWLVVAAGHWAAESTSARLQVQIDGQPIATFAVPPRAALGDPDPLVVSLAPYAGREVDVEIVQLPSGQQALVDWRSISLADRPPGTLTLLDEDQTAAERFNEGQATAAWDAQRAYRGLGSLTVRGGQRLAARLPGLPASIREYPRLGEYRFLRFAWRKVGGERICLGIGHDGRFGPASPVESRSRLGFRYDAGIGGASLGLATRLDNRLPEQWVVVTRDLFADFGAFEFTGLMLACPDGESAHFDHIHLARTPGDLERLDASSGG
jgi:hypothetical protein